MSTALLFLGLFLVLSEAAPQDLSMTGPGGEALDCEKMNNGLWAMKEQWVSDLLPREFYRYGVQHFFGDQVDWAKLESFRISDTKVKTELVETTSEEFSHFLEWVEENSQPPVEPYEHHRFFRAPDNVNDLWTSEVSLASDQIVHGIDKVNMILNGGVFSTESHRFWQYSSTMEKRQLGMLRQLSEMVNKASGLELIIPEFLTMARNEGFQKSFMEELDTTLHHQVACLYPALAAKNLTFFNTIMGVVPEDELVKFVKDIATETFKAINSLEAEFNLRSVIDAVKKAFNEIDFDRSTGKVFLSFLKARSLVLGVDVHEIFTRLDRLTFQLGQGWWKLSHGKWPEMIQFITNLVTKTIKSDRFWHRLDEVYLEVVASFKLKYEERERVLEEVARNQLKPFMEELLSKMQRVQVKDEPMVKQLISWIEQNPFSTYLDLILTRVVETLSKSYLACFTEFYGKPDFNELSAITSRNSVARWVHSVVVTDWPEAQPVPAGFPQFVEQLQETILLLYSSVLGECAK
jgi:hypothetical protein